MTTEEEKLMSAPRWRGGVHDHVYLAVGLFGGVENVSAPCGRRGLAAYRMRSQRTQAVPVSVSSVLVGGRAEVGCSSGSVSVMHRP